jgi:Ca2+-binding EF-hand superfamily protein
MALKKTVTTFALVLAVAATPAAMAKDKKQHKKDVLQTEFNRYDTNRDGVLTRNEFPVDLALFDRADRNRDGRLTRKEARKAMTKENAVWAQQRMRGLDRNNDGVISRGEWNGSASAFDRLDINDDGVLSRADEPRKNARADRD